MMRSSVVLSIALLAAGSLQAGLIHSYEFSGNFNDSAGTADGSLSGGAAIAGGFLQLDGISGYGEFGSHLVPSSGSYSVGLDFRLNGGQSGIVELISQGFSGGPGFYIGSNGGPNFRVTDSWPYPLGGFPSDDAWHRVTLVVDAGANNSKLYLDGALLDTLSGAIATTAGGTPTRLGRQFGGYSEFFKGDIDNVRIYNSALTGEEVAGIAEAPEPSALLLSLIGAGLVLMKTRGKSSR